MINHKFLVQITYNKNAQNKIIYEITVSRGEGESKILNKRYSDINEFHNQILKNINLLKLQVIVINSEINPPEFPGRKLFGSTNKSEEGIQARSKELQIYFQELFNIEKLLNFPIVQSYLPQNPHCFLDLVSPPAIRDSLDEQQQQHSQLRFKLNVKLNDRQSVYVSIERYQVFDEVVVYYLRFKEKSILSSLKEWTYKLRYSELKQIHLALQESKLKTKLPQFPQKKTFGSTNEDPESIEQRREQLENYLNDLLAIEEVFQTQVIQYIIFDSKQDFEKSQIIDNMKKSKQQKQVRGDLSQQVQSQIQIEEQTKTQWLDQKQGESIDTNEQFNQK